MLQSGDVASTCLLRGTARDSMWLDIGSGVFLMSRHDGRRLEFWFLDSYS